MAEVERLCDEVLMMKAGRIVDRGTPDELIARYGRDDLEEVFLDIARDRGDRGMKASLRRIWGMVYRHLALYRRSWPRLVELAYWPTLHMLIWGFTASFFAHASGRRRRVLAGGALLGRRAAVGDHAAQPAGRDLHLPGGNLVAQSRPYFRQPAAAGGIAGVAASTVSFMRTLDRPASRHNHRLPAVSAIIFCCWVRCCCCFSSI